MSVADLACDVCGRTLTGDAVLDPDRPGAAVRLFIHPGDPLLKDDSILVCTGCWRDLGERLGSPGRAERCAVCGVAVAYDDSLHILEMTGRIGEAPLWQLCRADGTDVLNGFRFVMPKLRPGDLKLRVDFPAR